ncbi:MAG TPA: amino acid adenylation domain-containing protein [Blastocatellia bacterium]|nr:amino acid adenylation domain-containing protein [Blastocatellia bacterium]
MNQDDIENIYPLSPMQEGLLFQALSEPDSRAYFVQMTFELTGNLKRRFFEESWELLCARHDLLRTSFMHEAVSRPFQVVLRGRQPEIVFEDLRYEPAAERPQRIEEYRIQDRARGFDFQHEVLMRLKLFRLTESVHQFVWSYHHMLMDGWCLGILQREFIQIYSALIHGRPPLLPPVRPYCDYIQWLQQREPEAARAYWSEYLAGYEQLSPVPASVAAASQAEFEDREEIVELDRASTRQLIDLAAGLQVTLNTAIQGIWGLLLSRYNDADEVVFGVIVSGRPAELEGIEEMIGVFINAIPVRIALPADRTFAEVLKRLQLSSLESEPHHYLPLSEIQTRSRLGRELFDHMLVFDNYPSGERTETPEGSGLSIRELQSYDRTHYNFSLVIVPGERLRLKILYHGAHHSGDQIDRIGQHFQTALRNILKNPSGRVAEISILPDWERSRILSEFRGRDAEAPSERTVVDWLEEQAAGTPEAPAVICEDRRLTYRELNERANHLAWRLKDQFGIAPEERVAVLLNRSEQTVIAVLGILKSGAAYLPIDPGSPPLRIRRLIEDSRCRLILTEGEHRSSLDPGLSARIVEIDELSGRESRMLDRAVRPDHLAYVLYTSGSSGVPKGCQIEHRNLFYYLRWANGFYFRNPDEGNFGLFSSLSFDLTVTSLFLPLLRGRVLRVFPQEAELTRILAETFDEDSGIDCVKLTPSHVSLLEHLGIASTRVQLAIVGGEALTAHQTRILRSLNPQLRIFNEYGPTEATVGCVVKQVRPEDERVLIGRPIDQTSIYVLDQRQNPAPIGIPGEIHIAGPGLARGYLNREELDREKFVRSPFRPDERLYRTGDLGRWLPDGDLDYLGRNDDQVKIRGHRVEPGEVANRLESHPGVRKAVVVAQSGSDLAAYLECEESLDPSTLRGFLQETLPDYLIPSFFIRLDRVPLTPNGKVDRRQLPPPAVVRHETAEPRNEIEQELMQIWNEVLGDRPIGIHDNFFELGGHSLKAMQAVSRIHRKLGVKLNLRQFLEAPTIAAQSSLLRSAETSPYDAIEPASQRPTYELSHAQQRLWLLHRTRGEVAYNMPQAYLYEGELDLNALRQALISLTERHEALRTAFVSVDGEPRQKIDDHVEPALAEIDLSAEPDTEQAARRIAEREAVSPFDLERAPLLRLTILRLNDRRYVFLLTLHHIVGDGWSLQILHREVLALYEAFRRGLPDPLPPLRIQYKDFAAWQNAKDFSTDEEYWLRKLRGLPAELRLPYDLRPPGEERDFRGHTERKRLDEPVTAGLKRLAQRRNTTLANVMLALFEMLLFRVSRQDDFCIGLSTANRNHHDLERLIGFFVNILPIRARISSDMEFDELLDQVKQHAGEALEHQDYPFDLLIRRLNPGRYGNRQPLLNVVYGFQNFTDVRVKVGDPEHGDSALAEMTAFPISFRTSKFDLTLFVSDLDQTLLLELEYDTGLFLPATIEKLLSTMERFARQLTTNNC